MAQQCSNITPTVQCGADNIQVTSINPSSDHQLLHVVRQQGHSSA